RQLAISAQEFQVNWRGSHSVFLEQLSGVVELGANIVAGQKDLGSAFGIGFMDGGVAVGGGQHEAVHAQLRQECVKLVNFVDVGFLVDGGVRAHEEAGFLGRLDALDGGAEDTLPLHRQVVRFLK